MGTLTTGAPLLDVMGDSTTTRGELGNNTYATARELTQTMLEYEFTIKSYVCLPSHGLK